MKDFKFYVVIRVRVLQSSPSRAELGDIFNHFNCVIRSRHSPGCGWKVCQICSNFTLIGL